MKVKIWIEHNRWIRADVIKKDGKMGRNLYHLSMSGGLEEQVKQIKDYVTFHNPKEKIDFVS